MADGLRRLDGVANVEVDLQANVCAVTPHRDRLFDLGDLPKAVHAAGFRPRHLWITARGVLAGEGAARTFTVAGSDMTFVLEGDGADAGKGRVEWRDGRTLLVADPQHPAR